MHISGFLIFLAIVVYWASCMGPRALKWVGILFVSGCLVIGLGIAGLLVYYTYLDDARRQAERATQQSLEATRTPAGRSFATDLYGPATPVPPTPAGRDLSRELFGGSTTMSAPSPAAGSSVPATVSTLDLDALVQRYGAPPTTSRPASPTASGPGGSHGKADDERLFGTPPARVAPLRSFTLQEHTILDTLKVEGLARRLTSREKQEAIRLRRALVRGPLEAEDQKKLDALLQSIASKKQYS